MSAGPLPGLALAGLAGLVLPGAVERLVLPAPGPIFNPVTDPLALAPPELLVAILAGPFGLLAFVPLIPLVLLLGRRWPRAALLLGGLVWLGATLRPRAALVLLGGLAVATGWVLLLGGLRRRGVLGRRGVIGLVWLGLHALVLPLWWQAQQSWYPSPMAAFHNAGFAYYLLRFVAWGVALADDPGRPARLLESACWLVYPPCMRLGPVLRRGDFLRRLDAWDPRRSPAWAEGAGRFGLFLLGVAGIVLVGRLLPEVPAGVAHYYAAPERYPTGALLRGFYLVPVQVYLLLWTYNELACATSRWLGLRVDDNFAWLPRATSVRDFWRRWHVTVGAWLRDYVYIPLGGSRRAVLRNTVAVFAYCGLWHGASWSFLAWGLSQAAALGVQRAWDGLWARRGGSGRPRGRLWTAVAWLLTMHYQIATIVVFTDFDHLGRRLLGTLAGRLLGLDG